MTPQRQPWMPFLAPTQRSRSSSSYSRFVRNLLPKHCVPYQGMMFSSRRRGTVDAIAGANPHDEVLQSTLPGVAACRLATHLP